MDTLKSDPNNSQLIHTIFLYVYAGTDRYGNPTFSDGIELLGRWIPQTTTDYNQVQYSTNKGMVLLPNFFGDELTDSSGSTYTLDRYNILSSTVSLFTEVADPSSDAESIKRFEIQNSIGGVSSGLLLVLGA